MVRRHTFCTRHTLCAHCIIIFFNINNPFCNCNLRSEKKEKSWHLRPVHSDEKVWLAVLSLHLLHFEEVIPCLQQHLHDHISRQDGQDKVHTSGSVRMHANSPKINVQCTVGAEFIVAAKIIVAATLASLFST